MSGIWARSILASEHSITGTRLDTLLVRMPRCILAEFNTHRAFSRNAASSRAIPVTKLIEQVEKDPFIPMRWTKNQPGMQGYEECADPVLWDEPDYHGNSIPHSYSREGAWLFARDNALKLAKGFNKSGYHKQIINRLLEPWMWTIVCVSATEWNNFFVLRNHSAAEPHMQLLAKVIWEAREQAEIQTLQPGEWHLPWITQEEWMMQVPKEGQEAWTVSNQLIKLSVARCASTSYKTVDDFDMTLDRAQKLFEQLSGNPLHASPLEHVAQADEVGEGMLSLDLEWRAGEYNNPHDHRNFVGFRQLRGFIEREKLYQELSEDRSA